MRWLGGKSSADGSPLGTWIANQLPLTPMYVEPFCGMLGILLQRPRASYEIANDLDGRVTNWWEVVRDQPEELISLLNDTPNSEPLWREIKAAYDDGSIYSQSKLRQAWAFTILMYLSFGALGEYFGRSWTGKGGASIAISRYAKRLSALADRIRDVYLYSVDASVILERVASNPEVVIYCDPPYYSTPAVKHYVAPELDVDGLTDLLLAQQGQVAISGYPGEWDHLGWRKEEFELSIKLYSEFHSDRTECLWMNFEPQAKSLPFALEEELVGA